MDLCRRLFTRLGGGGPAGLCPCPGRERIGEPSRVARPWYLAAVCACSHAGDRRALSVRAAQTYLSPPLPVALWLRGTVLARWAGRRAQYGGAARPLLPRLLLGAVRCAGCCRDD